MKKDNLSPKQDNYSKEQEKLHSKIKKLYDKGYSYKRNTKYLNTEGIKTPRGKTFGVSGNSVYSILKKYKLRQERLQNLIVNIMRSGVKWRLNGNLINLRNIK